MEYKYFKTSDIIIKYLQRKYSPVDINLELLRCDYYNNILDMFLELIQQYYSKEIFSKKPFKRSISNILSNYIFFSIQKNK